MLQLKNSTRFSAQLLILPDRDGIDTCFTVVKATFTLGETLVVAEEQAPVVLADEHYGDPLTSSILAPSDVCLERPGTDVVVSGSAWAPEGKPTWQMDVSAEVGPVAKTVRAFGDRVWRPSATGAEIAWTEPFVRMPLVWERAFGGRDETERGTVAEPRNPIGTGFRAPDGAKPLDGLALPNLEDPLALITSCAEAPAPAGFGPVAPHWLPRRAYAGTYDEAWQKHRAPYLPADFDPRFFQVAPIGLTTKGHLQGGEGVILRGLTPAGLLQFSLPTVRLQVRYRLDGRVENRPAVLETVSIEPDANRVVIGWRAAFPCDKKALKIQEVEVAILQAKQATAA